MQNLTDLVSKISQASVFYGILLATYPIIIKIRDKVFPVKGKMYPYEDNLITISPGNYSCAGGCL